MDFSSSGTSKKINRKLNRLQHILLKETGIVCVKGPTKHIVISNAGLSSGLSEEIVYEHFSKFGAIENIVLLPGKSCCFVSFQDISSSVDAYTRCNGYLNLAQDNKPIYLLYVEHTPSVSYNKVWDEFPPGLIVINEFISREEETRFLELCNFSDKSLDEMKHRKVIHFGYQFAYDTNNIDKNSPLPQKIPKEFDELWERFNKTNLLEKIFVPDQLTVNHYQPGQGIPHHIDTHSAFEDPIVSLSLQSPIVMEFRKDERELCVLLSPRSLCIISGESRYDWSHGIKQRKFDIIKTNKGFSCVHRDTRVSFTFRKILDGKCNCGFKSKCDSSTDNRLFEDDTALKLEKLHVHDVYEKISSHFNETRHKPWPKVLNFVQSFEKGSIFVDIGCGNGKYLDETNNIFKIGCDTSFGLLDICKHKKYEILAANCLKLPVKDGSVDGAICIAVIHHLATEERRLDAIKEILRILKVNGKALIYVWAKDQHTDNEKTSYLKQRRKNRKKNNFSCVSHEDTQILGITLPVHTNRTPFQHSDVMVPWKTKEEAANRYLRFYHVFDEFELQTLCSKVRGVNILQYYYDEGNWCVVLSKNK